MAKNYNPFDMWGSWLGAALGFIGSVSFDAGFSSIQHMVVSTSVGFLIGWGIHSLFRKFG